MSRNSNRVITWWVFVLIGAALALLIAWLGRVVSVPLTTLLTVGAVLVALSWLVVLTTVPWSLYFAAQRAAAEMIVSRERGIAVRPAYDAEAGQLSRRMLRFALASHLGTALVSAAIAYFSGNKVGYYIAGIFALSTAFRPAAAYFAHVHARIKVLTRESMHPREDLATLRQQMDTTEEAVEDLRNGLQRASVDLRRTESELADSIAHARQLLTTDLNRLQDAQVSGLEAARSRSDLLEHKIDQLIRRIEATLDGVSDHQELLTGLRALVRMVRSDPA